MPMLHDYDEYFDTKVSRPYGNSKVGGVLGTLLGFIGLVELAITIADMFHGPFTKDKTQTDANYVYTWDENPFWPSYGKGFWVGLILFTTGLIGCVSACEHTLASIYSFAAFSVTSMILNFYLLITALIPIAIYGALGGPQNVNAIGSWYHKSLAFNATLVALGGLAFLLTLIASIVACYLVGCCEEKRGQGADFLETYYDQPFGGAYNAAFNGGHGYDGLGGQAGAGGVGFRRYNGAQSSGAGAVY